MQQLLTNMVERLIAKVFNTDILAPLSHTLSECIKLESKNCAGENGDLLDFFP
jgi:hypothetical protein